MRSFTLIELIVVVIIIGILASFAVPAYQKTKENALAKEAIANLKLIQAAEKIYRMEMGSYAPCDNTTAVNTNLRLSIPTGSPNWNYTVDGVSDTAFRGKAVRVTNSAVKWCINQASDTPYDQTAGCN